MVTIRNITMFKDVGFDLTHKHVIDFTDEAHRDAYFEALTEKTVYSDCNYNKAENTLNLQCEWDVGLEYTYCTFLYNNMKMFYFVTGCRVVNDQVTGFELVLDVWQTFLFKFTVGEGMITREHVDRWDAQGRILWRRSVNEDHVTNYEENNMQKLRKSSIFDGDNLSLYLGGVFITYLKTNIGESEPKHSAYVTIFIPVIHVETKNTTNYYVTTVKTRITVGTETTDHELVSVQRVLAGDGFSYLSIDPASVIGISYQPIIPKGIDANVIVNYNEEALEITLVNSVGSPFPDFPHINGTSGEPIYYSDYISAGELSKNYYTKSLHKVYSLPITISKPVKPTNNTSYSYTFEPEMFKSPYIMRELIDVDGSIIAEIPDQLWLENRYIFITDLLKENQSVDIIYMMLDKDQTDQEITDKEIFKTSSKGLLFKVLGGQLDVPSDQWKSYMISSRDTDREMLQSTINQHGLTSLLSGAVGMGGISGMAGSGKAGAGLKFNPIQGGVGAGIGAVMGGANWIANNYFAWEQQEIKERGIRNQPNNLLRSATDDGLLKYCDNSHSYNELKCNSTTFDQACQRYHKYGYRVDMCGVPNIRTRKYYNFVQTSQIRIEGSLNQAIKDAIADIFNNGVTIWHGEHMFKEETTNKFKIDYGMENIERTLIT